jgi:chromosomal replication initiator protein
MPALPEHRAAWQALWRLASMIGRHLPSMPVVLHGPTGTGKTFLVGRLLERLTTGSVKTAITEAAAELGRELQLPTYDRRIPIREMLHSDLLVVEDLQHLPVAASDELAYIIDHRRARGKANVLTMNNAPIDWQLSPRLTSRLVGGLLVSIPAISLPSRRRVALAECHRRNLRVSPEVVDWLARHEVGLRPMYGDLTRLELLMRTTPGELTLPMVEEALMEPTIPKANQLDEIAKSVLKEFNITKAMLVGPSRLKNVVQARQRAMYLARQAGFTLMEIGAYFGNRDHSTVRHAIEKMSQLNAAS